MKEKYKKLKLTFWSRTRKTEQEPTEWEKSKVINLSSYNPSKIEIKALALGHNFSLEPTDKENKINIINTIAFLDYRIDKNEKVKDSVKNEAKIEISKILTKQKYQNLSKEDEWIRTTISKIKIKKKL